MTDGISAGGRTVLPLLEDGPPGPNDDGRPVIVSRAELHARDRHRCWYCGADDKPLTLDHVLPRSEGGGPQVTNIVSACVSCNSRKQHRPLDPITELLWMGYEQDVNHPRGWGYDHHVSGAGRGARQPWPFGATS